VRARYLVLALALLASCSSEDAGSDDRQRPAIPDAATEESQEPDDDVGPANEGPGWRITFRDEFNGAAQAIAEGDSADCYESSPVCLHHYSQPKACSNLTADPLPGLADLNKCTWSVIAHYNWMDQDAPLDQRINSFDPAMVEVKDGMLNLKARSASYPEGYNCGQPLEPGQEEWKTHWGARCPIVSGGLFSVPNAMVSGFAQTHGRFEVMAKLPDGLGSWPAHWLLPVGGHWPRDGEIDIMEYWSHNPRKVAGRFHTESAEGTEHISTVHRVGALLEISLVDVG